MKARRDISRLKLWGKIIRLPHDRLLKRVYMACKPITGNAQTSMCGGTRRLLFELNLGHLWNSEELGEAWDWIRLTKDCIKARETRVWSDQLQMRPKLRFYRLIKFDLDREEYLQLPPHL